MLHSFPFLCSFSPPSCPSSPLWVAVAPSLALTSPWLFSRLFLFLSFHPGGAPGSSRHHPDCHAPRCGGADDVCVCVCACGGGDGDGASFFGFLSFHDVSTRQDVPLRCALLSSASVAADKSSCHNLLSVL